MPVWVQLQQVMHHEQHGQVKLYQPGDWVKVGKQLARQWIADGAAVSPYPESVTVEEPEGTTGIMVFGQGDAPEVGVETSRDGLYELRWHKTCFLQVSTPVKAVMYAIGFGLINQWEIAVPLVDYRRLAKDEEATDEEKAYTERIIRDLRVPMYDTRLMFVRRCESTRRLFEVWESEGQYTRLSFLRSLYRVKPLVLALPVTWTGQWAPTNA